MTPAIYDLRGWNRRQTYFDDIYESGNHVELFVSVVRHRRLSTMRSAQALPMEFVTSCNEPKFHSTLRDDFCFIMKKGCLRYGTASMLSKLRSREN
jgi:hypothetical protein